jgi:hypothetical protein
LPSSDPSDASLTENEFYIYIFFGYAHSAYQSDISVEHTIYYWNTKDNCIDVFSGMVDTGTNYAETIVYTGSVSGNWGTSQTVTLANNKTYSDVINDLSTNKTVILRITDGSQVTYDFVYFSGTYNSTTITSNCTFIYQHPLLSKYIHIIFATGIITASA